MYEETQNSSCALDYGAWHGSCGAVSILSVGGFAKLFCPGCRVFADLEGVSRKISLESSLRARSSAPLS